MEAAIVVVALVGAAFAYAVRNRRAMRRSMRAFALTQPRARTFHQPDGHDVVRAGVVVRLRLTTGALYEEIRSEISAEVCVPPGLRVVARDRWDRGAWPDVARHVRQLPAITVSARGTWRSDEPDAVRGFGALVDAWEALTARELEVLLSCDGERIACVVLGAIDEAPTWDAAVGAVAALARFDRGLGATLLALDGAQPIDDERLAPAVVLAPDDLLIGVRDRVMFAELRIAGTPAPVDMSRAGDGVLRIDGGVATFTWHAIERDPARLRAAVDLLRSLVRAQAPYR